MNESDTIIFFLTNYFVKTNRFKYEFKFAKTNRKAVIIVILGILNEDFEQEIDNFQTVNIINKDSKIEALNHFKQLFLRSLQLEDYETNEIIKNLRIDLRLTKIKPISLHPFHGFNMFSRKCVEITSENTEIVIKNNKGDLIFFNIKSEKFLYRVKTGILNHIFCVIDHLNQILVVDKRNYYSTFEGILFEKLANLFEDYLLPIYAQSQIALKRLFIIQKVKVFSLHMFRRMKNLTF